MASCSDLTTAHIESRVKLAEQLCEQCTMLYKVAGMSKIRRKCEAELRFLKRILKVSYVRENSRNIIQEI